MQQTNGRPRLETRSSAGNNGWTTPQDAPENGGHDSFQANTASGRQLARALGWFSLGLGLASLTAPSRVAHLIGLPGSGGNHALLRAIGVREIASGIGVLTQKEPAGWLWARIGGDALDLALLTRAMGHEQADRGRVAAAAAAVIGVTAADAYATRQVIQDHGGAPPEHSRPPAQNPRIASAITVKAPRSEVFAVWDGFAGLPRFMDSYATVRVSDDRLSHWRMALPGGLTLSWDVVITDVTPNERIAWTAGDNSKTYGLGEVRFRPAPGNRGTEVLFEARFDPPGGDFGSRLTGLFTDPLGVKLDNDLRRFKQLVELGEIVKSDDSIAKGLNPAQPVATESAA